MFVTKKQKKGLSKSVLKNIVRKWPISIPAYNPESTAVYISICYLLLPGCISVCLYIWAVYGQVVLVFYSLPFLIRFSRGLQGDREAVKK